MTRRRRWTEQLAAPRIATTTAATESAAACKEAEKLLKRAAAELVNNPILAAQLLVDVRIAISEIAVRQERIRRYMLEAEHSLGESGEAHDP